MFSVGIISKIISINNFYHVQFNISGFVHFGKILMVALDKRNFIYKFNYKNKNQPHMQI